MVALPPAEPPARVVAGVQVSWPLSKPETSLSPGASADLLSGVSQGRELQAAARPGRSGADLHRLDPAVPDEFQRTGEPIRAARPHGLAQHAEAPADPARRMARHRGPAAPDARVLWRSGGLDVDFIDPLKVTVDGEKRRVGELLNYHPALADELTPRTAFTPTEVLTSRTSGGVTSGSPRPASGEGLGVRVSPITARCRSRATDILYHMVFAPVRGSTHAERLGELLPGPGRGVRRLPQAAAARAARSCCARTCRRPRAASGSTWAAAPARTSSTSATASPSSRKVYVVDLSPSLLNVARERIARKAAGPMSRRCQADATTFEPPTGRSMSSRFPTR